RRGRRDGWLASHGPALTGALSGRGTYGVEIRPVLVATIQRSPQRTIESTLPPPGTLSPRVTRQTPLGPWMTAVPLTTSRSAHPAIVVGFVSGNGVRFARLCSSVDDNFGLLSCSDACGVTVLWLLRSCLAVNCST